MFPLFIQSDFTPLHASAWKGHTEVVAMLLKDLRVDINARSKVWFVIIAGVINT